MPIAPHQLREEVRRMILSSARDLADEPMSIGEMFTGDLPANSDEYDRAIDEIGEMIRTATVTITWPDEKAPEPIGYIAIPYVADGTPRFGWAGDICETREAAESQMADWRNYGDVVTARMAALYPATTQEPTP